MVPATVSILVVSTIVFVLGMISARSASRSRKRARNEPSVAPQLAQNFNQVPGGPDVNHNSNQENPKAMAMASSGSHN